jgi:predicted transposase YbfD/YdcC
LEHGIPSHDTFRRLFLLLNPNEFSKVFMDWVKDLTKDTDLEQICIDGKALRKSYDSTKSNSAIHMINAWSTGASLALGQLKAEGKSNELKTVPKLLDLLDIEGCIVSADALSCQVKTAQKIRDKQADYLLALKNNQKSLEKKVKDEFAKCSGKGSKPFKLETITKENRGHGRIEKRTCKVISAKDGKVLAVNPFNKWPDLNSIIEVNSMRTNIKSGEYSEEKRYYISSRKAGAEYFINAIRSHWEVENKLHWVLDVIFKEDECRSRAGFSGENFAMLRQFALNLIKQEPSKKAIRRKQNIAGWDDSFLIKILIGGALLDA